MEHSEDQAGRPVAVSSAVVRRLPRYYRYLRELIAQGRTRISSGELSALMNVTASQIRQDLWRLRAAGLRIQCQLPVCQDQRDTRGRGGLQCRYHRCGGSRARAGTPVHV